MDGQGNGLEARRPDVAALHLRLRAVLELIAEGHDNAAIARRLGIRMPMVKAYVTELYAALEPPCGQDPRAWVLATYGRPAGTSDGAEHRAPS
jgi:DNA-binding CsgD family transcriptional regulator